MARTRGGSPNTGQARHEFQRPSSVKTDRVHTALLYRVLEPEQGNGGVHTMRCLNTGCHEANSGGAVEGSGPGMGIKACAG